MDFDPTEIAYVPTTGVRRVHETPLVVATDESLKGYGCLVDDPRTFPIEIVRWPAQGWRPIDANSGDQGGVTEGLFEFWWKGETLYARNNAVGDSYLFGWSNWPEEARDRAVRRMPRERALIWRANYHPDGGQLFYPLKGQSFVVPLALPGDDVTPEQFITLLVRRRPGPLHPSRTSGTGRSCRTTTSGIPRPPGPRPCARLGRFRQGVRLLSRRAAASSRVGLKPTNNADLTHSLFELVGPGEAFRTGNLTLINPRRLHATSKAEQQGQRGEPEQSKRAWLGDCRAGRRPSRPRETVSHPRGAGVDVIAVVQPAHQRRAVEQQSRIVRGAAGGGVVHAAHGQLCRSGTRTIRVVELDLRQAAQ